MNGNNQHQYQVVPSPLLNNDNANAYAQAMADQIDAQVAADVAPSERLDQQYYWIWNVALVLLATAVVAATCVVLVSSPVATAAAA